MNRTFFRVLMAGLASAYILYYAATSTEWHFIDNVNLIFHEAGHTIFSFTGKFIDIAMGSGFQVLIPLIIALYFFSTAQRLSGAICLMWVGQNLINVSVYAGDAVRQQLPLLGGDSSIHDWHFLLATTHTLHIASPIALSLYALGVMVIGFGIAFALLFALRD